MKEFFTEQNLLSIGTFVFLLGSIVIDFSFKFEKRFRFNGRVKLSFGLVNVKRIKSIFRKLLGA